MIKQVGEDSCDRKEAKWSTTLNCHGVNKQSNEPVSKSTDQL